MRSSLEYFLIFLSLGIFIANILILVSLIGIKKNQLDFGSSKNKFYYRFKFKIQVLIVNTIIAGCAISFLIWNLQNHNILPLQREFTNKVLPQNTNPQIETDPQQSNIIQLAGNQKKASKIISEFPPRNWMLWMEVDRLNNISDYRIEKLASPRNIFSQHVPIINEEFTRPEISVESDDIGLFSLQNQADRIWNDSSATIEFPKFYVDSHLLFGAELINPFSPTEFLVSATRLWKTDIRFGISQAFKNGINPFLSIRINDSPQTNDIKLYEAGIKINNDWGRWWFGQKRIQAGNKSFYLNDAFDRTFWDQGLVFDYLMRGIGTTIDLGMGLGETELFFGSDQSSYIISGAKYSIQPFAGFNARGSGLYVARDKQFSAFGSEIGLELEESFNHFTGYQVIGYKNFKQDPSPIQELTIFVEGRYLWNDKWNFGAAYFFRRLKDTFYKQDESKMNFDIRFKAGKYFMPVLQAELFRKAGFSEIHLGFSAYLLFFKSISIVPRFRYIITEFGSDMGFIGIEGGFYFGKKE